MKLCYCGRSSAIVGETFGVDSFLPLGVSGVVPAHHSHSWCDGVTIGAWIWGCLFPQWHVCLVSIPNYTGTSQRTLALGGLRHAKAHCSVGAFGTVRSHILHRISLASWSWSNCVLSMTPAVSTVLAPYFTFMRRFHIFRKWPTSLVIWISLQTRWVDSSSPFLNHSQWTISVMCGGRSCLQKWPAQFGIDIKSALQQSADCGFPQSIFLLGNYGLRLVDFRFHFGAYLTPHLIQPVCYPPYRVCISALLTVGLGGHNLIQ